MATHIQGYYISFLKHIIVYHKHVKWNTLLCYALPFHITIFPEEHWILNTNVLK